MAANLAGIGRREQQGQGHQQQAPGPDLEALYLAGAGSGGGCDGDGDGGLLSAASYEFLSLLVLRLFLLADKPYLAVLFCEAIGCWHIALLIAKVSFFLLQDVILFLIQTNTIF